MRFLPYSVGYSLTPSPSRTAGSLIYYTHWSSVTAFLGTTSSPVTEISHRAMLWADFYQCRVAEFWSLDIGLFHSVESNSWTRLQCLQPRPWPTHVRPLSLKSPLSPFTQLSLWFWYAPQVTSWLKDVCLWKICQSVTRYDWLPKDTRCFREQKLFWGWGGYRRFSWGDWAEF